MRAAKQAGALIRQVAFLMSSERSGELFGGEAPPEIRQLIEDAKSAPRDQIGARLWAIQARAPDCLPIYYLLYKFHAGRREFDQAERAALTGLDRAGSLCALPVGADPPAVSPANPPPQVQPPTGNTPAFPVPAAPPEADQQAPAPAPAIASTCGR